jgi:RND family efflux transporter MFP subunit
MSDTKNLLNQLRLERDEPSPATAGRGRRVLLGVCAGIALTTALGGALLYSGAQSSAPATAAPSAATAPATPAPAASTTAAAEPESAVLNASGYIVARRQATVSAKLTARVIEVLIDEGQHVMEGEVIARLDATNISAALARDSAQLAQAQAGQRAAQVAFANEEPLFARMRQQLERGVSSQQDFDTAKARYDASRAALDVATQTVAVAEANLAMAQRNLDDTVVRAPFDGIVTVKAAQPGEMVSPVSAGGGFTRTGIGTIVDMNSLEVDVDVSESFINRIVAGQPVTVRLNAYPDWSIDGRVITVVPTADRAKATVKVRIALAVRDARILPEMGARVTFLREPQQGTTN